VSLIAVALLRALACAPSEHVDRWWPCVTSKGDVAATEAYHTETITVPKEQVIRIRRRIGRYLDDGSGGKDEQGMSRRMPFAPFAWRRAP